MRSRRGKAISWRIGGGSFQRDFLAAGTWAHAMQKDSARSEIVGRKRGNYGEFHSRKIKLCHEIPWRSGTEHYGAVAVAGEECDLGVLGWFSSHGTVRSSTVAPAQN